MTSPPGPPLIDDPENRVYRGLDPSLDPQERVDGVQFPNRGLYLVICGVQPHFVNDYMFGYVRVVSELRPPALRAASDHERCPERTARSALCVWTIASGC